MKSGHMVDGTPIEDLCREDLVKLAVAALDTIAQIAADAADAAEKAGVPVPQQVSDLASLRETGGRRQ